MKKLFLCSLVLLMAGLVCGADKIQLAEEKFDWRTTARSCTREKYPNADGVYLSDRETVSYQADGTAVSDDDYYYLILTERGKRAMLEESLHFCDSHEKASFLKVEVLRPNGEAKQLDIAKSSSLAIDPDQMGANIYDPSLKILRFNFSGLEVGDVVHVITRRTTFKPRIPGVWCGIFQLQLTDPILKYEVIIDAPEKLPLKSHWMKDGVPHSTEFSKRNEKDRILYRWVTRDIPQIIPEPGMPPIFLCGQRLLASTVPDWQTISRWYYQLCRKHMDAVTPAMREKVKELTAGAQSSREKLQQIFRFVSQEVRYLGITMEKTAPGYEPHDVSITFEKRYGVCRDKAALLASMLELAGIQAHPVLFMAGHLKDSEVPDNYFNHAITEAVLENGTRILMDPTYENTMEFLPSGDAEMSYLAATKTGDTLRLSPAENPRKNLIKIKTTGEAQSDGIMKLRTTLNMEGFSDHIFRSALARWPVSYRRHFFASRLKKIFPGIELKKIVIQPENIRDIRTPLFIELEYDAVWLELSHGADAVINPPNMLTIFGYMEEIQKSLAGLEQRKYPLKVYATYAFESSFELQFPSGYRPVNMPEGRKVFHSPALHITHDNSFSGQKLTSEFRMQLLKTRLNPSDYQGLKRLLREWEPVSKISYLMSNEEKLADPLKTFADADAVLTRSLDLSMFTPDSGKIVEKKRILLANYAGIKRYSVLKIPYNPVWDDTPAVTAKIISKSKKRVRTLSQEEINIMDQPWNTEAPRYPGGKILTVSFPRLSAGTVIEYTVERRFRKRIFIDFSHSFAAYDPLESDTVSVQFAKGLTPAHILPVPDVLQKPGPWKFTRSNVSAIPFEPDQPDLAEIVPSWGFSCGNWKTLGVTLKKALESHTVRQTNAEAKAKALCASAKTEKEKILALRNFILREIRLAGPVYTELPLENLSDADRVLADEYGNSADRAILLKTMLNAVGIQSEFVPVSDSYFSHERLSRLEKLPNPREMSHILVKAGIEPNVYYLGEETRFDELGSSPLEGHIALNLDKGYLHMLEVRCPTRQLSLNYNITLHSDGSAELFRQEGFFGSNFGKNARMFAEFTPEEDSRYLQGLLAGISQNAVLTKMASKHFKSYPGKLYLEFKIPHFAQIRNGLGQFELPEFRVLGSEISTGDRDRFTAYERSTPCRINLEYRITLPQNWKVRSVPNYVESGKLEDVSVTRRQKGNVLYISASMELKAGRISAVNYDRLERMQSILGVPLLRTVIFNLKKP